eukprot:g27762.t1
MAWWFCRWPVARPTNCRERGSSNASCGLLVQQMQFGRLSLTRRQTWPGKQCSWIRLCICRWTLCSCGHSRSSRRMFSTSILKAKWP